MTVKEAAAYLECKPSLIYRLIKEEELAFSRIGINRGKIVIDLADVVAYKHRKRSPSKAEYAAPAPRRSDLVAPPDADLVMEGWKNRGRKV